VAYPYLTPFKKNEHLNILLIIKQDATVKGDIYMTKEKEVKSEIHSFDEENVQSEEEDIIVNPDDIEKEKEKHQKEIKETHFDIPDDMKYYNRGNTVAINYETMGRFNIPYLLYFDDYTIDDVNNITLSRQDDILENLIAILNNRVNKDANIRVEDMLIEEFLETLIGIKMQFNTPLHKHMWVCSNCQSDFDDSDQQVNETEIDLRTLKYISIEEADVELRKYYKGIFDRMTSEEFKQWCNEKYQTDKVKTTISEEVAKISIGEPIKLYLNEHFYAFRFNRVGDIVKAHRIAQKKYTGRLKQVKNKRMHGKNLVEFKEGKEEEIKKIREMQAKDTVLFSRALTLFSKDGVELNPNQCIEEYRNLPRVAMMEMINFFNKIKFGIQEEREFECTLCGNSERRSLQQEFNPIELLPLDTDSTRKLRKSPSVNIFIGA